MAKVFSFTKDGEGMENAYGAICAAVVCEYLRIAYGEKASEFEAVVLGKKYKTSKLYHINRIRKEAQKNGGCFVEKTNRIFKKCLKKLTTQNGF